MIADKDFLTGRGWTPMIADKDFLTGRGWTRMKNVFAIIKTEAI